MNSCIVICGQTATGKSDLAVLIACQLKKRKIKAEIISADSRQVYTGFDKTSAKITTTEMRGIPHHMLSVTSPKKDYSVADYKKEASTIIKKLHKENIIPIICGGTGLYIDNLVFKKTIPEVLPNPKLRTELEKLTTEELFTLLNKKDPARAKTIDSKNKRRIIRALEIIEELGSVPIEEKPELLYNTLFIGLTLPKEILEDRVQKRTIKRMKSGMVKEVYDLHTKTKLSYERLEKFGMEYKWLSLYSQKNISKEECIDGINKDTLAYAKRQVTWFKKNPNVIWLSMEDKKESEVTAKKMVFDFLR